jgi:hypothetical protein
MQVIGRFHPQKAEDSAKWLHLGVGLGEPSSRFIPETICYLGLMKVAGLPDRGAKAVSLAVWIM